ncbi:Calx-beta domain-containing protein [Parapedobacter sp. GCM10030251]|uniref:Calx-beta domain-containing protein n=1 Tax=Parapedobacter sp. GCM10030251 TaxID=3273419 RepID=UPI00361BDA08
MKRILLACLSLFLIVQLKAADYYWVGGAGSWSDINHWSKTSGGAPDHSIIPNLNDDVYFDANSGLANGDNIDLPTTSPAYCRNMSWVGVTVSAGLINRGQPLYVYGNLELAASVRYGTQGITFMGSTPATLKMNGAGRHPSSGWYNPITVNKPGSSLTLLDGIPAELVVTTITLTAGTLDMSDFTHSFSNFTGNNNNERSVDISNATLTLAGTWDYRGTNNTINTTNSYISALLFQSDRFTFPKVDVTAPSSSQMVINNTTFGELTFTSTTAAAATSRIGANNTVDRLEFKGGGALAGGGNVIKDLFIAPSNPGFVFVGNNTITGSLHANTPDCNALSQLYAGSGSVGTTITFGPGAVVDVQNVLLTNLAAAGSIPLPITVTGADGGGNTGWDIQPRTTGRTLYWVGGAGDWNDIDHWSATSGGDGGYCVPFTGDDVVFDERSGFTAGDNTVTATAGTAWCHNMTWTNLTGAPTFDNRGKILELYGSLVLDPTLTAYGNISFKGTEAGELTANGFNLGTPVFRVERTGANGGITLMDDITHPDFAIFHNSGKLLMPNRTLHISRVSIGSAGVRTLDITNSTITLEYEWQANSSNCTWVNDGAGSFIIAKTRFLTNGLTYPKVHCGAAGTDVDIRNATIEELLFTDTGLTPTTIAIGGNNTIGTVEFKGAAEIRGNNTITNLLLAPSRNYIIRNTQTINGLFSYNNPDCSGLGEMRGVAGTSATLNFGPASTKVIQNVLLQNMAATGTGVPVVVTGADAGGNSGFDFTASAGGPRYWVGGSGDWNEAEHWSTTPGGPGGACVPTVDNDVFFDANSFTSGSSEVTISQGHAYCRNMNWTGAGFAPTFTKSASFNLEIWGNLVMNPAVTMNTPLSSGPTVLFTGPDNSTITSNGAELGNFDFAINKPDGRTVTLTDDFNNVNTNLDVRSGGIDFSGRTVTVAWITDNSTANPTHLNITNATINGGWYAMGAATTVLAEGSQIKANLFRVNTGVYGNVEVTTGTDDNMYISNATIDDLLFSHSGTSSQAYIREGNTINRLEFLGRGYIAGTGNSIDTLIFAPGKIYTFAAGTNTTINDAWYGSGTPCNPTQIISSSTSSNATVTKTNGTVDFDYIRLSRITAAGSTPFKAREHSVDLSVGENVNWDIAPYDNSATITGFGPDRTVCADGFPIVLNTEGFFAGPSATYLWSDGSTENTLTVTDAGTYSVIVQYPDGCSISGDIVITKSTVTVEPITGADAVCVGSTTTLQSVTEGGVWSSSDAAIATVDAATGVVTGIAPGTATITYTVTNDEGCTGSQQMTITVNPLPEVDAITGTLDIFEGETTTLSSTTPDGVWSSSNTAVATVDASGVVTGVSDGTAAITYTVTNDDGCTASVTATVTVDGFSATKRELSVTKTADAQEPSTNGGFWIGLPTGVSAEEDITVTYTVGGTAGTADYTALSGTAVIPAGQNGVALPVIVASDMLFEGTETVLVTLNSATGADYTYTLSATNGSATVEIADDNTTFARELHVSLVSQLREGPFPAYFRIRLPGNMRASEDITINYTLSGSAINGVDYTNQSSNPLSGTAVLLAGQENVDILVRPVDDRIIEGTENVIVTLTGGTTATIGNFAPNATQGSMNVPLTDNDDTDANRTLSVIADGDAAEPATHSSFTISLPEGITVSESVTVNYTISGTASNGTDYSTIASTAVIPAGDNGVVIPVTVTDDGLMEADETVILTINNGSSASFAFTASTIAGNATVNIADDENTPANRVLSITKTADAAEPATPGAFLISLPTGVLASEDVTVSYNVSGTATAGSDFAVIPATATIPAGQNGVQVPLNVMDDNTIESTETVIVTLTGGTSANLSYTVSSTDGSATAEIADDDFDANSQVVLLTKVSDAVEGGDNGQYRISFPPGVTSSENVVITFSLAGMATNADDYVLDGLTDGDIVIPAGVNEVFIEVDAEPDDVVEGPEDVILNLGTATSSSHAFTIDPASNGAVVNIIDVVDDEGAQLQVISGTNGAEPSTSASFTVQLAGAQSAWPITVGYQLSGTATSGVDYQIGTIVIAENTNSVTVNLDVRDDMVIEPTETVIFTLLSGSATDGAGNGLIFRPDPDNDQITINIDDNDAIADNRILSVAATTDGAEPNKNGSYTVSLPDGYSAAADITLSYAMSGTAVRNTDYTVNTITLPAYQNSVVIPLTVIDDKVIENTESAILTLGAPVAGTDGNGFTYTRDATEYQAMVNIIDDDNTPANRMVKVTKLGDAAEGGSALRFYFTLPDGITSSEAVTVNYTIGGTAVKGTDYNGLSSTHFSGTAVISPGFATASIGNVVDDLIIEGTETVILTITDASSASFAFTADPAASTATANIADNDDLPENRVLSVETTIEAAESGTDGLFTISLPAGITAAEDLTVNYTVSGTATSNVDYTDIGTSAVIPAGQNSVTVTVPVIDDQMIENTETVVLTIVDGKAGKIAFTASPTEGEATAHIADNDNVASNLVVSVQITSGAAEPGTNGAFRVSLPTGITVSEDVTVNYTVGGTATAGDDYMAIAGAITILAGQNGVTVPVTVVDDQVMEPTETVVLTLSGGSSTSFAFTGTGSATVEIADNESTVPSNLELTISKTADAAEPGTDGGFTISLRTGITVSEDVTVSYTVGGTATAGDDYVALTAMAVIPAGQGAVAIPVEVTDDQLIEPTETVIATLTGGSSSSFAFTGTSSATVDIADDDSTVPANFELTISKTVDAAEPGMDGGFRISLPTDITVSEDVTVTYTVGGTATAGDDYVGLTGTAVIPAGQETVTIPVEVTDDQLIEPTETVIATLTGGSSASFTFTGTGSATVDFADDDSAVPANLVLTISKTADGAEPGTDGGFTISLPTGITVSEDVTVNYSTGGTAAAGDDYVVLSGTAMIPAGRNRVNMPVAVVDDQLIEGTETVVMTLTGGSSTSFTFTGTGSTTVEIMDDDNAPENLVLNVTKTADAAEPLTDGAFNIALPAGLTATEDITVNYSVTGTAVGGQDYIQLPGVVVIPAGDNSVDIPLTVIDDQVIESIETVIVGVTGGSSASFTFAGGSSATLDIVDDDNIPANLELSIRKTADGGEPGTDGEFTVSLPTGVTVAEDITVHYTVSGTATGDEDYAALSGTVIVPAEQNSVRIPVIVTDDHILELTERVIVTLTDAASANFSFTAIGNATVEITDDESAVPSNLELSIAGTTDGAEPGTDGAFTISLPAGITVSEDVTVTYTVGGTAIAGDDYAALSGTAVIPAGQNGVAIPVTVVDDQVIEATETVIATLAGGSSTGFTFTGTGSATVEIADDESTVPSNLALAINKTADAAEPGTDGAFTISLPAGITVSEDVTVTYTVDGTAMAGDDYAALTGTAVIPAGQNGVAIPVAVVDDQVIEATETVIATLTGGSSASFTFTGTGSAAVEITDDESAVPSNLALAIDKTADAAEPGTDGGFIISLPAGITVSEDVTVTYTVDGTAMAADDYAALSGTVVIPAGQNGVAIPVTVVDDQVIEPAETVIATLAGGSSAGFTFTGTGSATVEITDDESAVPSNLALTINKTADAAEPGTDGAFTISLPAGIAVSEDVTVTYTVDGTAMAGDDYAALSGTAVIPAGQNGVAIPVTVVDDQVIEATETVIATLAGGSSTGFTFTGTGSATVEIADDESTVPSNLALTIDKTADAAEPGTDGAFTISLPAGITVSEDVTVTYTVGGTAIAGDDYAALSGTAVIPAGRNGVAIPVTVVDDQVIEPAETVIATLTGGSSAGFTFTGTGSATVNITDDESTVPSNLALTIDKTADAAEPGTDGGFIISLPAGITVSEDVTVTYTVDGTAMAGDDYAALSGTAVIKTGDNSVVVPVTILDDDLSESVETVIVTLSEASSPGIPVTIGTANSAMVTIADDDERIPDLTVAISVDNASPMAGEQVEFTIEVSNTGPDDATGVAVLSKLPSGYTFVAAEVSRGTYDEEPGVWAVGDLAVGESRTLRITAVVNGEGDYVTRAEVSGNEDDPDAGNNESEASVSPVHPPRAVADAGTGYSNKALVIPVLANDAAGTHPLDAGSVEIVTRPQHGTVSIDTDGTVTYIPATGYVGGDRFSYRVKDSGGNWSEPAEVTITVAANPLKIANIFTPNGDGLNDRFEIIGMEGFDKAEVVVFNRWGNEIYRHNDYDNSWGGGDIPEGTYYYVLTLHKGNTKQVEKGWVVLKRK